MHFLKAAWCRTYQQAFRCIYPLLPYRIPEPLNAATDIPKKLGELHISSALLVTDQSIRALELTAPLEAAMDEAGIRCVVFDGALPNPTFSMIESAFRLAPAKLNLNSFVWAI